jgi:hypothetical protein
MNLNKRIKNSQNYIKQQEIKPLKEVSKMKRATLTILSAMMIICGFPALSHAQIKTAYLISDNMLPDFKVAHVRACWTSNGDYGTLDVWSEIKNIGGNKGLNDPAHPPGLPIWIIPVGGKPGLIPNDGAAASGVPYAFGWQPVHVRYNYDYRNITGAPVYVGVLANYNIWTHSWDYKELDDNSHSNNFGGISLDYSKFYNVNGRVYYGCWDAWQ